MSESKGLGDSIEKFTKKTGLKSLLEMSMRVVGKKDCGCNDRKDFLNKKFPYNNK